MKTIKRQIISLILCLLFCVINLPGTAFAQDNVNIDEKCSLSVSFMPGGEVAENVNFKLYRVADISLSYELSFADPFTKYPIVFENNQDDWRKLAVTLFGYVCADNISADYSAKISSDGSAVFNNIPVGVYLITADVYKSNHKVYVPQPVLVSVPNHDIHNEFNYNVIVNAKYNFYDENEKTDLDVLKIWKNENDNSNHPDSVIVELYNGTELYDTVKLSHQNNWEYTWEKLSAYGNWNIREKSVFNGYTVSVDKQSNSFIITNSAIVPPLKTNKPSESSSQNKSLPQTGLLWWPVPVLIAGGLFLIIIGYIRNRGSAYEN